MSNFVLIQIEVLGFSEFVGVGVPFSLPCQREGDRLRWRDSKPTITQTASLHFSYRLRRCFIHHQVCFILVTRVLHIGSADASYSLCECFIFHFIFRRQAKHLGGFSYEHFRKKIQQKIIVAPNRSDYGFFSPAFNSPYFG